MPINLPALREAIEQGTRRYLTDFDHEFNNGLFGAHGKEGKNRGNKIILLLAEFDATKDPNNPTPYELKVLALADAIFLTSFLRSGGPTLKKYIHQKLKENKVFTFDDASQNHCFIHGNYPLYIPIVAVMPVGHCNSSEDLPKLLCNEIQAEIRAKSSHAELEPMSLREQRADYLKIPLNIPNNAIFTAYYGVQQNASDQNSANLSSTICNVM